MAKLKVAVCPAVIVVDPSVPGIEKSGGGIFTATRAVALLLPLLAVIFAFPLPTAVTSPVVLTVAEVGLLEP